jgi:hypothetical protein
MTPRDRRIAGLMAFEATTLAVFAVLHLSGALGPGSGSSSGAGAGVPEALICVALVLGLRALVRSPARGRPAALAATGFAIFGFIVGLTFTVRGGAPVDLIYHLTMFPVLVVTGLMLARGARGGGGARWPAERLSRRFAAAVRRGGFRWRVAVAVRRGGLRWRVAVAVRRGGLRWRSMAGAGNPPALCTGPKPPARR